MKLTKYGHACVRLEKDGRSWSSTRASSPRDPVLDGADAVLITHEHFDHLDVDRLAAASPAWRSAPARRSPPSSADLPGKVQVVRHGDDFQAAGFAVKVFGEWHAKNHPDVPIVQNVGFLVDDEVFYPGDALTVPGVEVDTLLVPTNAPWLKLVEMVDYLRDVRPAGPSPPTTACSTSIGLAWSTTGCGWSRRQQKADMRRLPSASRSTS